MADLNHDETQQALKDLNAKICAAEMERNAAYLASILADDLVFRRAGGAHVTKEQYLEVLRNEDNTYEYVHCDDIEVITVDPNTAFVSLLVWAKGRRGEEGFKGIYRNTRLFRRRDGDWRLAVWFNTPVVGQLEAA
jgi:ketosteroid isomerase-like protein